MSIADKMLQLKQDIDDAYQAGYDKGVSEGGGGGGSYDEGYEVGKADSWGMMWDAIQKEGARTDYSGAFSYIQKWTKHNFKPKYDIRPTVAGNMFQGSFSDEETDLVEVFKNAGREFDLSKSTQNKNMLLDTLVTRLGVINCCGGTGAAEQIFRGARKLVTVEKWVLKDDGTNIFSTTFHMTYALQEIKEIEGVIGNNIDTASCPLNKETIIRIVNALSTETTGKTVNFSKTAVNKAFGSTTSEEFIALTSTRSNWSFAF